MKPVSYTHLDVYKRQLVWRVNLGDINFIHELPENRGVKLLHIGVLSDRCNKLSEMCIRDRYASSQDEQISLDIARNCILGKVHNARWVLELSLIHI